MKQSVIAFVASLGLNANYSGRKRTMYINGKGARRIKDLVKEQFPDLSFKLSSK